MLFQTAVQLAQNAYSMANAEWGDDPRWVAVGLGYHVCPVSDIPRARVIPTTLSEPATLCYRWEGPGVRTSMNVFEALGMALRPIESRAVTDELILPAFIVRALSLMQVVRFQKFVPEELLVQRYQALRGSGTRAAVKTG